MALAPNEALVTLAGHYVDTLAEQGENFTLMGYCFGGLLAAEIAGQLTECGKQVREMVVISSYQPPQADDARLVDYIFARAIGADLENWVCRRSRFWRRQLARCCSVSLKMRLIILLSMRTLPRR